MFLILSIYQLMILVLFILVYSKFIFQNKQLHLSFFHYIYYFLFNFLGAVYLYYDGNLENYNYFFATTLYPLISLSGMVLYQIINKKDESPQLKENNIYLIYAFWIITIGLYVSTIQELPIIYILNSDNVAASVARSLITKEYEGPKILFYLYRICVEFLTIFILIYAYLKEKCVNWKIICLYVLCIFIAILDTQKYHVINITLFFILVVYINKKSIKEQLTIKIFLNKYIFTSVIIAYVAIGLMHASFMGRIYEDVSLVETVIAHANSMIEDRLLFGQNRMLYAIFEMVPYKYDYFYGTTFPNPLRLLPYEPIPLSYLTYDYVHPEVEIEGVRGSGPAIYFGEIYANFGIIASYLSMLLFGFFVQHINSLISSEKSISVAFRYMLNNYFAGFAIGFVCIYNDEKFWFFVLMYILFKIKFKWNKKLGSEN